MAEPPPVQRPSHVRAQEVLDKSQRQPEQAIPQCPVAQFPPPVAASASLVYVAAADNVADDVGHAAAPPLEANCYSFV